MLRIINAMVFTSLGSLMVGFLISIFACFVDSVLVHDSIKQTMAVKKEVYTS
ncbi:MAG: hypothetical protein IPL09_05885 [Bacteroidetes bacterium]|nr:hypothetical protein [Bacteroidota bacterium]